MNRSIQKRKTRVIELTEYQTILYIKHLGKQPYNEVKFDCGKKLIVSYSLNYWQSVFQNFYRISRGILINPEKIVSQQRCIIVLSDNSSFTYSRRKYKVAFP
jgi:DNA-binding LytR/AlgR family response regulator